MRQHIRTVLDSGIPGVRPMLVGVVDNEVFQLRRLTEADVLELSPKQRFILSASPPEWAAYADELKHAADLLHKQAREGLIIWFDPPTGHPRSKSHVSRTYILLAGFALENVLKGLVVLANPQYVSSGKLDRRLREHDLIQLSHQVEGLVLSSDEQRLYAIAQEAIPYWGRHPVPLKAEELKGGAVLDDRLSRDLCGPLLSSAAAT